MGRYYSGSIAGKFWFGVQSSEDASHFGVSPDKFYAYYGCNCNATNDVNDDEEHDNYIYCIKCYTSLQDHLDKTEEDRAYDRTFYQEGEISYDFQTEHLPAIRLKVEELEQKIGAFMKGYRIVDEKDGEGDIEYDFTTHPSIHTTDSQRTEIARLCLGYQIKYCVETYGSCVFRAEL
jgi:hypothetical protein